MMQRIRKRTKIGNSVVIKDGFTFVIIKGPAQLTRKCSTMSSAVTSLKLRRFNIAALFINKFRPAPSSLASTVERALSIEVWSLVSANINNSM